MSSHSDDERRHRRWANLRFAVVGPLLAAPPEQGELQNELRKLSEKRWRHPISGEPTGFGLSTIQRWYYQAMAQDKDPVSGLERKIRRDSGLQWSMSENLKQALLAQYKLFSSWSYQLHSDNLAVVVEEHPELGPMPSYASVRRFMKSHGLDKKRRRAQTDNRPGLQLAYERLEQREVRSFEMDYVNALWHLDFHHGSLKVLRPQGQRETPYLLGVLDDRSRLCCHAQWYLEETADVLEHGLSQGFLKWGLPRSLMNDQGSAMRAEEIKQGLLRLGISQEFTLAYSPYQNGKQESFWVQVEGRLVAMLRNYPDLTLQMLNEATQAWLELEYNRSIHSELGQAPLRRFLDGPSVGRECPSPDKLRFDFCAELSRKQRRSDGTFSLKAIRFEVPNRFRHLRKLWVRYASWDLSHVWLVDGLTGKLLCRVYPLDKSKNADGIRRRFPQPQADEPLESKTPPQQGIAPLLEKLMRDYRATGLPPAYIPKPEKEKP